MFDVRCSAFGVFSKRFTAPVREPKVVGAFHEPHEFCALALIESGGGPPHSKTLARWPQSRALPPGFGVRRPCGALDCPDRFMVPMHAKKRKGAFHEPYEFRIRAPIQRGGGPPHYKA